MKIRLFAVMLLAFILAASLAKAQPFGAASSFCSSAMSDLTINGLNNGESTLLSISLLIVIAVLTLLAIIYAIGRAFGIGILLRFTQKEIIESIFNVFIIALAVGGLAFADNAISFLSTLSAAASTVPTTILPASSAQQIFSGICENYLGAGLAQLNEFANLIGATATVNALQAINLNFGISADVFNVDIGFAPFKGIYPFSQFLSTELWIIVDITAIYAGIGIFALVIYALLPIFFYVGVLLRAIPWTRPAGGALLALFFSFYIVFPSLLVTFSSSLVQMQPASASVLGTFDSATTIVEEAEPSANLASFVENLLSGSLGIIDTAINGNFMAAISYLEATLGNALLQLVGLVISLLISFDLLEGLGDLLGAPSLQSNRLLKNVI
ncbi:MAG: hypothetical protein ACP5MC_00895 [Candidatus Micrarchaeia archaeon]